MIEFAEEWEITIPICNLYGRLLNVFDANGDDLWDMTCWCSSGSIQIAEEHIVEGDMYSVSNVTYTDMDDGVEVSDGGQERGGI